MSSASCLDTSTVNPQTGILPLTPVFSGGITMSTRQYLGEPNKTLNLALGRGSRLITKVAEPYGRNALRSNVTLPYAPTQIILLLRGNRSQTYLN